MKPRAKSINPTNMLPIPWYLTIRSNILKETHYGGSNNSNYHNCRRRHKDVSDHISPNYLDHTGLGAVSILLFVLQSHKTFKIQVLFYLSCLNRNSIIVIQPMEFCNLFHIFLFWFSIQGREKCFDRKTVKFWNSHQT